MKLNIRKPTPVKIPTDDTGQLLEPVVVPVSQPESKIKIVHFDAASSRFTKKTTTRKERKQKRKQRGKARKK